MKVLTRIVTFRPKIEKVSLYKRHNVFLQMLPTSSVDDLHRLKNHNHSIFPKILIHVINLGKYQLLGIFPAFFLLQILHFSLHIFNSVTNGVEAESESIASKRSSMVDRK